MCIVAIYGEKLKNFSINGYTIGMRYFLGVVLLAFSLCPAFGEDWGLMPVFVNETNAPDAAKKFLLARIVQGQPVYFTVADAPKGKIRKYEQKVPELFNAWFSQTLHFVHQSAQEDILADIIPLLQRGADLQPARTENDAHIVFHFIPLKQIQRQENQNTAGVLKFSAERLHIYIPTSDVRKSLFPALRQSARSVALHEVGHALGLSDQYRQARALTSDEIFYADTTENSVMNTAEDITCDDATGLINAIDVVRGTVRSETWHGLCPADTHTYRGGTTNGRTGYRFVPDGYTKGVLETYENGQRTESQTFRTDMHNTDGPFAQYTPAEILQADENGRPLKALGAQGQTIYYAYAFDRKTALVLQDGKIKQFSHDFRYTDATGKEPRRTRKVFYAQDGKMCSLKGTVFGDNSAQLEMDFDIREDAARPDKYTVQQHLLRTFDKQGKPDITLWQENTGADFPLFEDDPEKNNARHTVNYEQHLQMRTTTEEQKELVRQADEWLNSLR